MSNANMAPCTAGVNALVLEIAPVLSPERATYGTIVSSHRSISSFPQVVMDKWLEKCYPISAILPLRRGGRVKRSMR